MSRPIMSKILIDGIEKYTRDGVELQKGAILTEEQIMAKEAQYRMVCNFFTAYPDLYIDLITPVESNFELYFFQRIFLRACLRYRYHYCVAPRAFSKTFLSILAMILKCMFQPGSKTFICAPKKEQGAKVAKEKVTEIFDLFPLLKKELVGGTYTSGADYLKMTFRNGSIFDIVAALDSQRGGRRHFGIIDEVRDHDGDILNEVVLPLLNVNRRTKARLVNQYEPHQAQIFITSAGSKNSYAYEKLIEIMMMSIITPSNAFCWSLDYRVPMLHGLLNKSYLNEIRMSPTYKEDSFAREYLSVWTGGGEGSWFDYDKISKHRKLLNPERHQKNEVGDNVFYLLSVDVARLSCQTVVSVFKVFERKSGLYCNLVNMFILGKTAEDKHFARQAIELKRLIADFNPREVVIDTNGLGVGLADFMIQPSVDENNVVYPAYAFFNDKDYAKIQPKDAAKILYSLKASGTLNSLIHSNCYAKIHSGRVQFLIEEQKAKTKLLATKVGQKMNVEERMKRLMPHDLTTKLFEEMANLRLKPTGNGLDVVLEQINKHYGKDKFSSFEYGLWRLKEIEEEKAKKNRKSNRDKRKLTFYSEGGAGR